MTTEHSTGTPLAGRWTVVTGASKGIGHGIASAFVAAGAHVMLVARGAEDLERAAADLQRQAAEGQTITTARADTSDPEAIETLFATIDRELPQLDVFVANTGAGQITPFLEVSKEQWDATLGLNLTGTFLCCQQAARRMVDGEGDRSILVISSIRGLGARPGVLPYAVTKAGLNQMVRVAAYELAGSGVRVNALSPGITVTPLSDANPEVRASRAASVPLGRAGYPDDMAGAAVYLCSPGASFVTGVNLVVDGGESLW
jgi:glucose 1-dehydrogenase